MTHIVIENLDGIKRIELSGHANFAEHGKDIVCAGISATVMLLWLWSKQGGGGEVLTANPDDPAERLVIVPITEAAQPVLRAAAEMFRSIAERYPDHVQVVEKGGSH